MMNNDDINKRWKRFKIARRILLVCFASIAFIGLLVSNENLINVFPQQLYLVVAVSVFIIGVPTSLYAIFWYCPKCGNTYSYWKEGVLFISWPWVNMCVHCDLPFGATEFENIETR